MVLFENVCIGQRVEVQWKHGIYRGTVKFKGVLSTKKGDWVGVALDHPVGDTNGMILGRRYFQCPEKCGAFVRADKIRFIQSGRCLFDKYHKVASISYVDDFLFDSPPLEVKNGPYDPIKLSVDDFRRAKSSVGDYNRSSVWEKPKHYSLRHSVGNFIPAATMLRSQTASKPFRYLSIPLHVDYWSGDEFERKPSIPKIHMPRSALKEQVQRGWDGAHYVREMTIPTGRDKIKFAQWNDISP
ncbi:uncharacterized protein LOC131927176 [Physella acuta]|uniref:uncharacterized protein LOC131927176 n=1 Tax=Physella acuta TaxID=109671 RepID=UPI0027DC4A26|nr:uncharacterized protein LOC131927176 [Physella acuta]